MIRSGYFATDANCNFFLSIYEARRNAVSSARSFGTDNYDKLWYLFLGNADTLRALKSTCYGRAERVRMSNKARTLQGE